MKRFDEYLMIFARFIANPRRQIWMFAKMEKCALRVAISYLGVVRRKLIARERNQNKIFDTLEMKLNFRLKQQVEYQL